MDENLLPKQTIRRPYTFDRVVRILFSLAAIAGCLYLLDILKNVLLPFLVACLLAYILEPVVKWHLRKLHLKKRLIPVLITLLEVLALGVVFCMIFFPYLASETGDMIEALRKYATTQIQIPYISQQVHDFVRENLDIDEISRWLSKDEWRNLAKSTLQKSWTLVSTSFGFLISAISWLIVFLYLFFIMLDYDKLGELLQNLVPKRQRHKVFRILDDVTNAMNQYFRGQFLIAFLVGILFSVGFLIIGLPMGVVLGLFIGILNLVPYLQLISLPFTILLCLVAYVSQGVDFWMMFWEAMGVYVAVQCIQDLILTPKIMGKAMGLNPAVILLSLSVWGALLGFIGLIIALPLTTLLLSYYDLYIVKRY